MIPKYAKLAKRADELERLVCPPTQRRVLRAIVNGCAKTEAMEKALAEHIAAHPEDAGRSVEDFSWILRIIIGNPPQSLDRNRFALGLEGDNPQP